MRELSIFIDESGDKSIQPRYFLLTLVFHDQAFSINQNVRIYQSALASASLPSIPFHFEPLINGRKSYASLDISQRKRLLVAFNVFVQRLPILYKTFAYQRCEYSSPTRLQQKIERDATSFLLDNLAYFQQYEKIKIYYDNGQQIVRESLKRAISAAISKQAIEHRKTTMEEYHVAQVADYLCAIELAALKYNAKENGGTYEKFFGGSGAFKKNWLKQARRKLFG